MADRVYPPPRGPPPGFIEDQHARKNEGNENPLPYHKWEEAVPDTSTFPPPPISGYLYSNTGNASSDAAERAHTFCGNTPLWIPMKPSSAVYSCVQNSDLRPVRPWEFNGSLTTVSKGIWKGKTNDGNGDCILLTGLPLYFAVEDSPLATSRSKTIYFEVKLLGLCTGPGGFSDVSGFSIGFAAQPYPTWRSPGWERASIGVFSDDGCRFVNDSWGGRDFTTSFKVGETVGLGMTFSLPGASDRYATPRSKPGTPQVEIFFTRNGHKEGAWDLHEEQDEEAGGVGGLEGNFDLYGAVGLFGGVDFEVCFDPARWLWKPAL